MPQKGILGIMRIPTLVALAACTEHARAQECMPTQSGSHFASDGAPGDHFGRVVVLGSGRLLATAPGSDDLGSNVGASYVLENVDGEWLETEKLFPWNSINGGMIFGASGDITDDLIAIGAPSDDTDEIGKGGVYTFRRRGSVWEPLARLAGSRAGRLTEFGAAVALDEDRLAIGQTNFRYTQFEDAAYVFRLTDAGWIEEAVLDPGREAGNFGSSVDIEGGVAVVGAELGQGGGAAFVFKYDGVEWRLVAELAPLSNGINQLFGARVQLQGGRIFVGAADGDFGQGTIDVFTFTGTDWLREAHLVGRGGSFGLSFVVANDLILSGTTDGRDDDPHECVLYRRSDGQWIETTRIAATIDDVEDRFGCSIAMLDPLVVIGVDYADRDVEDDSGRVDFFNLGCSCVADLDGNGQADTRDVVLFLGLWAHQDPEADFDGDGNVDTRDVIAFLAAWSSGC